MYISREATANIRGKYRTFQCLAHNWCTKKYLLICSLEWFKIQVFSNPLNIQERCFSTKAKTLIP